MWIILCYDTFVDQALSKKMSHFDLCHYCRLKSFQSENISLVMTVLMNEIKTDDFPDD